MIIKCCKKQRQMIAYVHTELSLLEAKHTVCGGMHLVGSPAANTPREETTFSVRLNLFILTAVQHVSFLHRLSDFNTCCVAQQMKWKYSSPIPYLEKVKMWCDRFMYARLFPLLLRTVSWTVPETTFSSRQGRGKVANWTFGVKLGQLISKLKWWWTNQADELVIGMHSGTVFNQCLLICMFFLHLTSESLIKESYLCCFQWTLAF